MVEEEIVERSKVPSLVDEGLMVVFASDGCDGLRLSLKRISKCSLT